MHNRLLSLLEEARKARQGFVIYSLPFICIKMRVCKYMNLLLHVKFVESENQIDIWPKEDLKVTDLPGWELKM